MPHLASDLDAPGRESSATRDGHQAALNLDLYMGLSIALYEDVLAIAQPIFVRSPYRVFELAFEVVADYTLGYSNYNDANYWRQVADVLRTRRNREIDRHGSPTVMLLGKYSMDPNFHEVVNDYLKDSGLDPHFIVFKSIMPSARGAARLAIIWESESARAI